MQYLKQPYTSSAHVSQLMAGDDLILLATDGSADMSAEGNTTLPTTLASQAQRGFSFFRTVLLRMAQGSFCVSTAFSFIAVFQAVSP